MAEQLAQIESGGAGAWADDLALLERPSEAAARQADGAPPPQADLDASIDDALRLYLNEINRVPLLTASEEVVLAKRLEAGDESARRELVDANLRLVVNVAKRYATGGLPLQDLIQEGSLGLMQAAERFDWRRGFKFSTYATWWIRQSVTRALSNNSRTIRLPVHVVEALRKIRRITPELALVYEREPTAAELGQALGMNSERVAEIVRAGRTTMSLEQPVGEDGDESLADFVEDPNPDTADRALLADSLRHDLREALAILPERQQTILVRRFGLDGRPPWTLDQLGVYFGVTRERVRQLQVEALRKVSTSSAARGLRDYLAV